MSLKKKAPGRGPSQVEAEIQVANQSAAARRAAESELGALIARFAPKDLRLVNTVRKSLRKRLPCAFEVAYEYRDCFVISLSPSEHGYEGIFAIRGSAEGVKLYFNQGKKLQDPEKLLRGSGGQTRWISVERASMLAQPAIARLLDEAIAENRVPFANSGRAQVVLRSTAAKRRKGGSNRPSRAARN